MIYDLIDYQSSLVDWCESNYFFSNIICEWNNSWSSLLYSIFSYYIYNNYNKYINDYIIYFMIFAGFIVGMTSFLFHSTLSIAGQILDESSIILFIISSDLVINRQYTITIIFSIFLLGSFYYPFYSRFILFILGLLIINKTYNRVRIYSKPIYPYFKQTLKILIMSIFIWICDLVFCDHLLFALHFIWHILSAIALYNLIILTILMHNKNVTLTNKKISLSNPMYFLKDKYCSV